LRLLNAEYELKSALFVVLLLKCLFTRQKSIVIVTNKKPASCLHRTAQPHTLAIFRSWGSSVGAGRIRLAGAQI